MTVILYPTYCFRFLEYVKGRWYSHNIIWILEETSDNTSQAYYKMYIMNKISMFVGQN